MPRLADLLANAALTRVAIGRRIRDTNGHPIPGDWEWHLWTTGGAQNR